MEPMDEEQRTDAALSMAKVVRVEEAARQLGIGRTMAYGLVASGALRSMKVGSRRLVPLSALDEFIAQHSQQEHRCGGCRDGEVKKHPAHRQGRAGCTTNEQRDTQ